MARRIRGADVSRPSIVCPVCGIAAERVQMQGKPSLEIDAVAFAKSCVEQSLAPEPFRCPNLFSAAMDAGWIAREGSWNTSAPSTDS
jgi:hypothetical protein